VEEVGGTVGVGVGAGMGTGVGMGVDGGVGMGLGVGTDDVAPSPFVTAVTAGTWLREAPDVLFAPARGPTDVI